MTETESELGKCRGASSEKRDAWMVWLGPEEQTECTTVEEATNLARKLTRQHRRRAWLHDAGGYPLKPIEV